MLRRSAAAWLLAAALALSAAAGPARGQASPPSSTSQAPASSASAPSREIRASFEAARGEIEQVEARLRQPALNASELQELRPRLDPVADRLRERIAEIGPQLDAAKARLDQLGPKPKEDAPSEGAEVARDRAEREAAVADLDEANRLGRALLLQIEQLTASVTDRRRAVFANALLQKSYSLFSPALWVSVAGALPRDFLVLQALASDVSRRLLVVASPLALGLLGLALGAATALHISRRRLAPKLTHRDPEATGLSASRRTLAALVVLLVEALPAALGALLVVGVLTQLDMLPRRLEPVAVAIGLGVAFLAFTRALTDALLAPDLPAWRLVEVPDRLAAPICSLIWWFALTVVTGRVLDSLNQAIFAALPLSVATKAVFASAAALVLAVLLRRVSVAERPAEEACLGPYIPTGPNVAGPIRVAGWALTLAILVAVTTGYVALASFLVDQIAWVGALAGLLCLGVKACDHLLGGTLKEHSRVSTTLQANLGLRRRSLQQLGVLASGVGRVALFGLAVLLALAPWGVESNDFASSVRAAYFGVKIGDVTISLSSALFAVVAFGLAVIASRIVQRWLADTFLPTTELDAGLRNSIATVVGYIGYFGAFALAFGYLGLSAEKIAIVAGALSVGIGFGLQSIVNNFVSGLILLGERPIRVGDLVVVGDSEGYVRRISVRATEIETFDRSTVIVPNSSLISGTVKNRVRDDRSGRIVLPVNVLRSQDPAHAAELLIAAASAHADVLKEPPPKVVFKKIGETWLEFELVCYVEDVSAQLRVTSDLNFAVFRTLTAEGILPPLGPGETRIGGLDAVRGALEAIADALGREQASAERSKVGENTAALRPRLASPT